MSADLSDIGEFGLIEKIQKDVSLSSSVLVGIGDDAAVTDPCASQKLLLTTDMMVEGVHFSSDENPRWIGRKALAVNISDIAAMGGVPQSAVISFGAPLKTDARYAKKLFAGINQLAKEFGVDIVGGDTVRSQQMVINIALTGCVKKRDLVLRKGAQVGHKIFVTGCFGNSFKSRHHLKFVPRIAESQFLVQYCKPSAMLDVSDGLAADLGHILKASHVSARLEAQKIPLRKGAQLKEALSDGEDFELLFTLSPLKAKRLKALQTDFVFQDVGEIIASKENSYLVYDDGTKEALNLKGFTHF